MVNKINFLLFISLNFVFSYSYADLKVHYIPLDVETYVAVTTDNIEEQAHFIFTVKDDKLVKLFQEAISSLDQIGSKNSSLSDLMNVRVKIVNTKTKEIGYYNKLSKLYTEKKNGIENNSSNLLLASVEDLVSKSCSKKSKAKFLKMKKCK